MSRRQDMPGPAAPSPALIPAEPALAPPPAAASAALIAWFAETGIDYPWRRTHDAYAVLVSEMMLQQTQVKSVLGRGYYTRWLENFPDVQALAAAGEPEVLRAWEGLGYYARARNLLKCARAVVATCGGKFPESVAALEALPGIGPYTARAVAAFAFNQSVPVIDANVTRVLARLVNFREPVDSGRGPRVLAEIAIGMLPPHGGGRAINSALMELGQQICLPRKPECESCPVQRWCRGRQHAPEILPIKKPRNAIVLVEELALFAVQSGSILLHREAGRRRHGLWKLPERQAAQIEGLAVVLESTYSITHHKVHLRVFRAPSATAAGADEAWFPISQLESLPMPAPYRKALARLLA